jgi:hypothetical protein
MEVVVRGESCTAAIGGKQVVNITLDPDPRNSGAIAPGLGRRKGKVGFQTNTGAVRFRKVEIKELAPPPGRRRPVGKEESPFFNGEDLTGWEGLPGFWKVEGGCIVGSTPEDPRYNTFLCSKKKYKDFELKFKVRIKNGNGNSGVQIRSRVVDPQKYTVRGPQCDMGQQYWGSLYGEDFGGMMKAADADLVRKIVKQDGFNDYSVKVVGKHVTIKLNGATTVDDDFPNMPDEGVIAWQLHKGFPGQEVTFKDIEFTDLSRAGREAGFTPLFNGKDLTGWTALNGRPAAWAVRDGFVEVVPGKGNIMTEEKFGPDFRLHVEFWLPLMPNAKGQGRANSGVFLQGRYEVQILDSFRNDTFANGSIGALYGLIAPDKGALQKAVRPPEEWQTYDITFHAPRVDGQGKVTEKGRVTVILNGVTVINDGAFDRVAPGGAIDGRMGTPGPILLQDHGSKVRFRKVEIKGLPPATP